MSLSKALTLANKGNIRAAEEALIASFDDPDAPIADWPAVIQRIVKATKDDSAETLAWATLDAIQVRLAPKQTIPPCGRILRLFSKNAEFRDRAVELYQQAYDHEDLEQLIEISGLRGGKPVRRALQTLDLCLAIKPGDFVVHKDEGPAAKVVNIESETWNVRLETPTGEELFDPVTLGDQYELVERNDFRVLRQFDPDGFTKKLGSNPVDIVLTMVRAHDNKVTSDDLESMLSPRYIAAGEWSKWWTKARSALKKNPNIRLEGRNPVMIVYQEETIAIEDEMWSQFDIYSAPKAWLDLGQKYLRECKNRSIRHKPEFLLRLREAVAKEAAVLEQRQDSPALTAYLTAAELSRMAGEQPDTSHAARVIEQAACLRDVFFTLQADVYWPMALQCVQNARPDDWPEAYAQLIPLAAPSRCDELVAQIRSAGKAQLLGDVVQCILSDVVSNINGLCWLYQGPKDPAGLEIPPLTTLLTRLFGVLDQVKHSSTVSADLARDIRARIRSTLSAKKCSRFKECLEQIDEGMADALRTQVRRAHGLSEAVRAALLNCIRGRFPVLWVKPQKEPWEDPQTLYCTDRGYAAKEADLDELVNVKMKENAVAIGQAAEHGDLSENAEYKFALEERDLLRARVAEIQNQMAIARVLHRDDVPSDHVGIGSKVELRHLGTGRCMTLTFLGPWESDVERNILNYQAPVSQRLMGLKIGESIEFEFQGLDGEFEVVSIESGMP